MGSLHHFKTGRWSLRYVRPFVANSQRVTNRSDSNLSRNIADVFRLLHDLRENHARLRELSSDPEGLAR